MHRGRVFHVPWHGVASRSGRSPRWLEASVRARSEHIDDFLRFHCWRAERVGDALLAAGVKTNEAVARVDVLISEAVLAATASDREQAA
jgi:hypothetical protein